MKKLCLLAFIAFIAFPVFAQSQKGSIYLNNGTIVKGKFSFSNDLKKLKVESEGNIWVFDANEVDSISYGKVHPTNKNDVQNVSSIFFRTEMGVLIGNSENSQSSPFSLTGSLNYSVTPNFSVGGGLGVEFLKESYMPVFINLEYKLRNSYSTPYLFLKGGYQIALEESREVYYSNYQPWSSSFWPGPDYSQNNMDTKGGFLINPGIGYQRMFSSGFGMSFAFGYQFHRLHYSGDNDYGLDIDYNRLTIKLGIIFN
ncbi:MAG: hypothetical protein HQ522_00860 [Bacteroidetes bacterium]|nr:hypothetical protein [Bacteroidota bacterium]